MEKIGADTSDRVLNDSLRLYLGSTLLLDQSSLPSEEERVALLTKTLSLHSLKDERSSEF